MWCENATEGIMEALDTRTGKITLVVIIVIHGYQCVAINPFDCIVITRVYIVYTLVTVTIA